MSPIQPPQVASDGQISESVAPERETAGSSTGAGRRPAPPSRGPKRLIVPPANQGTVLEGRRPAPGCFIPRHDEDDDDE